MLVVEDWDSLELILIQMVLTQLLHHQLHQQHILLEHMVVVLEVMKLILLTHTEEIQVVLVVVHILTLNHLILNLPTILEVVE